MDICAAGKIFGMADLWIFALDQIFALLGMVDQWIFALYQIFALLVKRLQQVSRALDCHLCQWLHSRPCLKCHPGGLLEHLQVQKIFLQEDRGRSDSWPMV